MNKFTKMLQKAHAGELGAYYAYLGHTRATQDPFEKIEIQKIKNEEWEHVEQLKTILEMIGSKPDLYRDVVFTAIGKTLGFLCKYSGRKLALYGALFLEKIGAWNYDLIAEEAMDLGLSNTAFKLRRMYETERTHERTIKTYLMQKTESHQRNQN